MPFEIKVWAPIDADGPQIYQKKKDAEEDLESLELMQPENRYEIVEV